MSKVQGTVDNFRIKKPAITPTVPSDVTGYPTSMDLDCHL